MEIDWSKVKKETLWHYEDLIKKLLEVLSYGFVQEFYNHTMAEAVAYSENVRQGYLQGGKEAGFVREVTSHFQRLGKKGIKDYLDLLQQVDTKTRVEKFLDETGFSFDGLVQVWNYLFRWVLPFKCPVKELLDTFERVDKSYIDSLKKYKIRSNLDVLENFRTKRGRAEFSRETGVPVAFLVELVHRADLSRLAYVRGKTIKHLCGGGYDRLDKLAGTDLERMEADMTAYYVSLGKRFSDFKAIIPLDWMIGGARVLPNVVEA